MNSRKARTLVALILVAYVAAWGAAIETESWVWVVVGFFPILGLVLGYIFKDDAP